jgi:predicted ATPase
MKIEIKNLGPISNFKIDIANDLNVIFGKNNIGKSYAITAIYLIIKNLTSESFKRYQWDYDYYLFTQFNRSTKSKLTVVSDIENLSETIKSNFKDKNIDEVDVTEEVRKIITDLINKSFVINLDKSFRSSFSSIENLNNKISNESFAIKFTYNEFDFDVVIQNQKLIASEINLNKRIIIKKSGTRRKPLSSEGKLILYYNQKESKTNDFALFQFIYGQLYASFKNEVSEIIKNVYFLPASRSGLYQALSTFSAVIAELSKSRTFLTNKIELPNISEPVSDYFLFLSRIQDKKTNKKYTEVVSFIENDLLKGKINFNKDTKKIVFSPDKIKTELDLSFTSSMISEIAPIVAFLKYIIDEKQDSSDTPFFIDEEKNSKAANLIFIEEPEAHLHPVIQVKLLELFAKLIKLNVKIIMTSHSNYMFNKLSNLILDETINYNKVGSYLMNMTNKGSVVDFASMRADDNGIADNNFADIAEELYEERINIYNKLNNELNRKSEK